MISAAVLREWLDYDPATGVFRWRKSPPGKKYAGVVAGSREASGYIRIKLFGRKYWAHRLAVLWMTGQWPAKQVDHKNRLRSDNRWDNLRGASHHQNQQNRVAQRNSVTGIRGVSRCGRRWRVDFGGEYHGLYASASLAEAAYKRLALETHKEFAPL